MKRFFPLLIIFLFLITGAFSEDIIYGTESIWKNIVSSNQVMSQVKSEKKIHGYIIQFKEEPVLEYKNNLEKDIEQRKQNLESKSEFYRKYFGMIES